MLRSLLQLCCVVSLCIARSAFCILLAFGSRFFIPVEHPTTLFFEWWQHYLPRSMLCRDCCRWCVLVPTHIVALWLVMSCYDLDTVPGDTTSLHCKIPRSLYCRTASVCLSSDSATSCQSHVTVTSPYAASIMSFYSCTVVLPTGFYPYGLSHALVLLLYYCPTLACSCMFSV